ncbi:hypothetical protein MYX06_00170 [Patescibacteria group bacterium AH-259-L05]|nr:hypothetical protein [Patescibacteria group bacterium AH-259-L05]
MFDHPNLDPRLSARIDKTAKEDGISVKKLQVGDVIEIDTLNHTYRLKMLDPKTSKVEVSSDDPFFIRPVTTHAIGSNLTNYWGSVKQGLIMVGYSFALGRDIYLPLTQTVRINGVQILPRDTKDTN